MLGKTTIADIGLAYILYKLLCLKNPQDYYGLNSTATIAIAFFNITLSNSYGVAYGKMQDLLQNSPWFLDHGKLVGNQNVQYVPGKSIELIVGSKPSHIIGKDVFCLTGDTVIKTTNGDYSLESLYNEDKPFKVYQYDTDTHKVVKSSNTSVHLTKYVDTLVKLEFEDGSIIRCTPDHSFLVNLDGEFDYVQAKDLTDKMDIVNI